MSPQHDWLQHVGPDSEPGQADETSAEQADAAGDGELAGASGDGDTRDEQGKSPDAGQSAEDGKPAEAAQQAGTAPVEAGRTGWSGRAVGPLSGLLPGAVELNADELPAEPAASQVAVEATPLAGEASPVAQVAGAVDDQEEPEPGSSATDGRWHAVLVGFVDDPHGSVEAARALIDEDIAAHIALLARRKEAMHAAWKASEEADTEALRVSLVNYRDLRKRLADVVNALPA